MFKIEIFFSYEYIFTNNFEYVKAMFLLRKNSRCMFHCLSFLLYQWTICCYHLCQQSFTNVYDKENEAVVPLSSLLCVLSTLKELYTVWNV